jgi:hypothetical protein
VHIWTWDCLQLFPGLHGFLAGNSHPHVHSFRLKKTTHNPHNMWSQQSHKPSAKAGDKPARARALLMRKLCQWPQSRCLAPGSVFNPFSPTFSVPNADPHNHFRNGHYHLLQLLQSPYFKLKTTGLDHATFLECSCYYLKTYQVIFRSLGEDQILPVIACFLKKQRGWGLA